ncbi:hypothetical protein D1007_05687 [Hordeum vulgare]|nr:hypothetical protein D1007_05687 [Hordeum vulgare]
MMYRIPASIDDEDYMGIENSALDVCLEHGLPPERRVAFKGFETGRRFLVCAQPHHLKIIHVKDDKVKPEANQCWLSCACVLLLFLRNMMRNNRIFQSLGIDAIASVIRKTNDVQEGTTNGVQEGSGVISDDPEYNPKKDEVVVHKTVKALKESRTKRHGVKKTSNKKRKSSEASAAMPPGRVMAPPPRQTKRILEPDEPDRVTRQKATMAAATDHQESPLGMDFESSVEMRDEFF